MGRFHEGEQVVLECDGRVVEAEIVLAHGRSLLLRFDAILAGYFHMMPVAQDNAGNYRLLTTGVVVAVHRKTRRDN